MQPQTAKEPRKPKGTKSIQKYDSAVSEKEPIHCQPVAPCNDLQVRIANRAYERRGLELGSGSTSCVNPSGPPFSHVFRNADYRT
jgi:hypothetical protein